MRSLLMTTSANLRMIDVLKQGICGDSQVQQMDFCADIACNRCVFHTGYDDEDPTAFGVQDFQTLQKAMKDLNITININGTMGRD